MHQPDIDGERPVLASLQNMARDPNMGRLYQNLTRKSSFLLFFCVTVFIYIIYLMKTITFAPKNLSLAVRETLN